ncbi:hypothetical protein B0H10DRAFT_1950484 [Mycena sp. CBHHK59/15]|nr:hypothetical protein B0H10DRAFT_1950484 [Mycena sp. CBHHK59/15]
MRNEATDLIFQDRESNVRRPTGSGKAARKQLAPAPAARKTASSPPRKRLLRRKHHAAAETFESQSHTPMDPLEALARLQSFNGCFSLSVLSIIQLIDGADEARAALFDGISDEVFATVIAMAFLNTKLGPEVERDSWEAMYDKARAFVENTLQTGEVSLGVNELETKAVSILF